MADLNEPKKETVRIILPPRPPHQAAVPEEKPEPLPASVVSAPPPAPPMMRPPASAPSSGAVRPPIGPPPPSASQSPSPGAASTVGPASLKPVFPPINKSFEGRGLAQTGPRKETARIAHSPTKATVKLSSVPPAPFIHTAPAAVAKPPSPGLVETVPTQLCWALLGISALTLLIQLWTYFA